MSGDEVDGLADKKFEIVAVPAYVEKDDLDHPGQKKRKLVVKVVRDS